MHLTSVTEQEGPVVEAWGDPRVYLKAGGVEEMRNEPNQ